MRVEFLIPNSTETTLGSECEESSVDQFVLVFVISAAAQQQPKDSPTSESWTVIRAGTLIDGKSDKPTHGQVIVIHGNRIESVGDAPSRQDSHRRDGD